MLIIGVSNKLHEIIHIGVVIVGSADVLYVSIVIYVDHIP